MLSNALCYKTKTPVIYNRGTKYEKTCDSFLAMYIGGTDAQAQAEADRLNKEHPDKFRWGEPIDWTKIDHFFINKQDEMY